MISTGSSGEPFMINTFMINTAQSLFRAIPNTEEQQEVLERAVRATEDEETGCEFIKEAHRLLMMRIMRIMKMRIMRMKMRMMSAQ